jgi:predicted dehydrogenase
MGNQQPKDPPKELDYDLWLGPAAWEPYRENHSHFQWRWYWNFAAGMTGDWGVHMLDIALLGMSKDDNLVMPTSVSAYGGKLIAPNDDRTTPDTQVAIYQFPGFVLQWETHNGNYGMDGGGDHGTEFLGTEGRLLVDRGGWQVWDKDGKPVDKPASSRKVGDHMADFLDAMRTRKMTRADIASLHQTTTVCHLANLAFQAGHTLEWDPQKEVVTNDRRAMDLLPYRRPYRKPWSLPNVKV